MLWLGRGAGSPAWAVRIWQDRAAPDDRRAGAGRSGGGTGVADRILIMNEGRIEQTRTTQAVSEDLGTPFAYSYLGAANIGVGQSELVLEGRAVGCRSEARTSDSDLDLTSEIRGGLHRETSAPARPGML